MLPIGKEGPAVTWACEWFNHYLITILYRNRPQASGTVVVHKIPVLFTTANTTILTETNWCTDLTIRHIPGKELVTADTLSRAATNTAAMRDHEFQAEVAACLAAVTDALPITNKRLKKFLSLQGQDFVFRFIAEYCKSGGPTTYDLPDELKPYLPKQEEYTINHDGLLICGPRIVVPRKARPEVLAELHLGHQGITKCRQRAKESVWWPGLSTLLDQYVHNCRACDQHQQQ